MDSVYSDARFGSWRLRHLLGQLLADNQQDRIGPDYGLIGLHGHEVAQAANM